MRFPPETEFEIPERKLSAYLFSESHSVGKWKAGFFSAIGFDLQNASEFVVILKKVAQENDFVRLIENPHGTKYVVDGDIQTPLGTTARVRTVWIREHGKNNVRLVTAYPAKSTRSKEKL